MSDASADVTGLKQGRLREALLITILTETTVAQRKLIWIANASLRVKYHIYYE